jgi:hypothetical protein
MSGRHYCSYDCPGLNGLSGLSPKHDCLSYMPTKGTRNWSVGRIVLGMVQMGKTVHHTEQCIGMGQVGSLDLIKQKLLFFPFPFRPCLVK